MEKNDPPTSFGVFKPVGHTVIAYSNTQALEAAAGSLLGLGFTAADLVRYTPQEMLAQVDSDMVTASPLASVGQELNLVKAHRALAEKGCSFLVVHATDDERAKQVDDLVRSSGAQSAQRYGRFMIEELVNQVPGETQVFESPDRGLDIDVVEEKRN